MIVTLIAILCVLHCAAGGSRAVCPTQPIEVVEGENFALPCGLDPPVDLSRYTVEWTKVEDEQLAYVRRHGRYDPGSVADRYRNRTTINHEGLSRGNMTLEISSANLSDSGSYKCFVLELNARCVVHVIVGPKDQQNRTKRHESSTTGPPLEEEPESEDLGAVKRTAVWKTLLPVVLLLLLLAALLLWKCDVIKICKKMFRGKKKMSTGPAEGDEDPHSAAEALTEVVVHDENHSS